MDKSTLTDLQMILLTVASRRKAAALHPLPSAGGSDGEAIDAAIEGLLTAGLVARAEPTHKRQVWREEDGKPVALILTDEGRAQAESEKASGRGENARASKIGTVVTLLRRKGGASLEELAAATGWQPHTMRAALTGLKKKGHVIERGKTDNVSRYRIPTGDQV